MHLFLSPHADDAVFSCGGHIARLTRSGERVVIFTVMAGDPPVEFRPSDYTRDMTQRWGFKDSKTAVAQRCKEDTMAGKMLGAEVKFGPYPDAIYRMNQQGETLYNSDAALFGQVHPNDPVKDAKRAAVIQAIFGLFNLTNNDVIHSPLGIGNHVDHQLVRDMGKAIAQWRPNNPLYFYEEFPYMRQGQKAADSALAVLDADVTRIVHPLDDAAVVAKIAGISCYKSQIGSFFEGLNAMAREIRSLAEQVGGEGEWRLLAG